MKKIKPYDNFLINDKKHKLSSAKQFLRQCVSDAFYINKLGKIMELDDVQWKLKNSCPDSAILIKDDKRIGHVDTLRQTIVIEDIDYIDLLDKIKDDPYIRSKEEVKEWSPKSTFYKDNIVELSNDYYFLYYKDCPIDNKAIALIN